jgi:hypothetical protein
VSVAATTLADVIRVGASGISWRSGAFRLRMAPSWTSAAQSSLAGMVGAVCAARAACGFAAPWPGAGLTAAAALSAAASAAAKATVVALRGSNTLPGLIFRFQTMCTAPVKYSSRPFANGWEPLCLSVIGLARSSSSSLGVDKVAVSGGKR